MQISILFETEGINKLPDLVCEPQLNPCFYIYITYLSRALLLSQLARITFDSHKTILRESIDSQMKNNGTV